MKRILLIALCLMLFFVGCGTVEVEAPNTSDTSDTSAEKSLLNESFEEINPSDKGSNLEINAQYIRTNGSTEEIQFPSAVVISSPEELDNYYDEHKDEFFLEHVDKVYSDTTIGFLDACEKYTTEYFEEQYLVLVRLREGSGSVRHEVSKITAKGDSLDVLINRIAPEVQTADMAEWHIFLEIGNDYVTESSDNINISLVELPEEGIKTVQMDFAVELFKKAATEAEGKNVLVSPLSVHIALAMTANGANGKTLEEMQALLCGEYDMDELNEYFDYYIGTVSSGDSNKLNIANSIWIRDDGSINVKDSFIKTNEEYYESQIFRKAFNKETVGEINGWVDENTNGMIDKIITQIDSATVMYLINAISFEDEWKNVYSESDIYDGFFTNISGEKLDVQMMSSVESLYIETENAKGFIKKYKDDRYSFVAVLPNADVNINDYISSLTSEELYSILLNATSMGGIANIPEFTCEYSITLNNTLAELGMPTSFDSSAADFSNIGSSDQGNLYIGNVLHKTFIQVDKRGTKASASTSVEVTVESTAIYDWEITLDRPFVYMIVDNETTLPVFIGALTDIE